MADEVTRMQKEVDAITKRRDKVRIRVFLLRGWASHLVCNSIRNWPREAKCRCWKVKPKTFRKSWHACARKLSSRLVLSRMTKRVFVSSKPQARRYEMFFIFSVCSELIFYQQKSWMLNAWPKSKLPRQRLNDTMVSKLRMMLPLPSSNKPKSCCKVLSLAYHRPTPPPRRPVTWAN